MTHQLDLLLEAPAVALLERVLQHAEPFERLLGRVVLERADGVVVIGDERREIAEAFGDHVEHRAVRRERDVLHEPRDLGARAAATPCPNRAAARRR